MARDAIARILIPQIIMRHYQKTTGIGPFGFVNGTVGTAPKNPARFCFSKYLCCSSEPPGFLNHLAQWNVKKTDFDGYIVNRIPQELRPNLVRSVIRKPVGAYYRWHCWT